MSDVLHLDRYLERIEWGGSVAPVFDTLAGILRAHMMHIPFENLDVLLGRPVRIDLEGVQQKLVEQRRGGYCFEQATLFGAVLDALGFAARSHSARVTVMLPRSEMPRTHMFLSVTLPEGVFVVDPGFGGLALIVPVPVGGTRGAVGAGAAGKVHGDPASGPSGDEPAETAVDDRGVAHRMVRDGDHLVLRARLPEKTVDCWATTLEQDFPIDFAMANHYVSTFPGSVFVNRMMLKSITPTADVGVMNREVTVRRAGAVEKFELADRAALHALLREHFGFDLPEVAQMRVPEIPEWT